jgi:hypothetical protein
MELKVMQVIAISNLRAIKANKPLLWNTLLSNDQQKTRKDCEHCKFKLFFQLNWSENVITSNIRKVQTLKPFLFQSWVGSRCRCPGIRRRSTSFRKGGLISDVISHYMNWLLTFPSLLLKVLIRAVFFKHKTPRNLDSSLGLANHYLWDLCINYCHH